MTVSSKQKRFFDDFGYIFLPGLMKEEVGWITEEYERLFSESGIVHDGAKRSSLGHIVEKSELLCTLLDHPKVDGLLAGLWETITTIWEAVRICMWKMACGILIAMMRRYCRSNGRCIWINLPLIRALYASYPVPINRAGSAIWTPSLCGGLVWKRCPAWHPIMNRVMSWSSTWRPYITRSGAADGGGC